VVEQENAEKTKKSLARFYGHTDPHGANFRQVEGKKEVTQNPSIGNYLAWLILSIQKSAQSSRLATQVSQHPNRERYSCANP
jgi:hypothetical protein